MNYDKTIFPHVMIEVIEVLELMSPPLSPLKNLLFLKLKVLQIMLIIDIFFKKVFFGENAYLTLKSCFSQTKIDNLYHHVEDDLI